LFLLAFSSAAVAVALLAVRTEANANYWIAVIELPKLLLEPFQRQRYIPRSALAAAIIFRLD